MKTKIKCWIVRNSASNIMCGGLERLFIYFAKPEFFYRTNKFETGDNPFSEPTQKCGLYKEAGWHSNHKMWTHQMSVGKWIGYDSEMSDFIWKKLCEHFHNAPMDNWVRIEEEGLSKQEDFLLELELHLNFEPFEEILPEMLSGSELMKLRKLRNFTLRDIEKILKISTPYLSQLENDKIPKPSYETIRKLYNFYKTEKK